MFFVEKCSLLPEKTGENERFFWLNLEKETILLSNGSLFSGGFTGDHGFFFVNSHSNRGPKVPLVDRVDWPFLRGNSGMLPSF